MESVVGTRIGFLMGMLILAVFGGDRRVAGRAHRKG